MPTSECQLRHWVTSKFDAVGHSLDPVLMCTHFGDEVAVVRADLTQETGFTWTHYVDGKPGSISQTIGEPLREQFEWLNRSWLLQEVPDAD